MQFQFVLLLVLKLIFWFGWVSPAWAEATAPRVIQPNAFTQGFQAIQRGDYAHAQELFTRAIAADVNSSAAYANRCLVEIYLQDYPAAVEDCTRALQLQPASTEAYLNRGLAYYRMGQFERAIADNDQVLIFQPADVRAYFNRGLARIGLNQHPAAIADYTLALDQVANAETRAEILVERGLAYFALQDKQTALADLNRAVALNTRSDRAYFNRGCLHIRQKNYLAAIDDFSHALQLNPTSAEAQLERAIAYYHLGNSHLALADLQQAAEVFQSQGRIPAYQHTLSLMQQIRQSQDSVVA